MIMGHTPRVTKEHGKVHEMCFGRLVIADVGMSRDFREELSKASIVVVEMDSEDSAAGTVFYEDIKSDAHGHAQSRKNPLFPPRRVLHW